MYKRQTKSRAQIVRENVFTLFNLLNFIIAGLLFAVGAYTNMLFLAVIFLNIAVGIAQELKAKKLVDELSILNRPGVCVRRGAKDIQIELDEVVKGDLMVLQSGNQICNDAVVVEGMLEVNESLLTGESDAVVKEAGSELYSGSSVISGKAYAKVTHVGNENYATKLANEVKKEKRVASELLGFMNKEAYDKTVETGKVTFFSRTKNRLWTKGEESGNFLHVVSIKADCDNDTLLIQADPAGPVCHTGTDTCWGEKNEEPVMFLKALQDFIDKRHEEMPEGSYTTSLFKKGVNRMAQKVGEEAVETVIEATNGTREGFIYEASDLIYHLIVLLTSKGLRMEDLARELKSRHKE